MRWDLLRIYMQTQNTSSQEELTKDGREEEGSAKSYGIAENSGLWWFSKEVGLHRNPNIGMLS